MLALNQITFNIVSFPYGIQDLSVKRLALMFPYRLSVKALRVQGVKVLLPAVSVLSVLSVKDCFKGVKVNGLELLRGVRGLGCGACVASFLHLIRALYIIKGKKSANLVAVSSSLTVLCQLAYTYLLLPLWWACPPNTLHVAQSQGYTLPPYTLSMTDPHPHNFGARCDIHPTLTQTKNTRMKKSLPSEQQTNNAMEAEKC